MDIGLITFVVIFFSVLIGIATKANYQGKPKKNICDGTYKVKFIEKTFEAIRLIVYSKVNETAIGSPIYYEFPANAIRIPYDTDGLNYYKLNRLKVKTDDEFGTILLWIDNYCG